MNKPPLLVKTILKGEDAKKFKAIKEEHGVVHNSEVIRICINTTYKEIVKEAKG